MNHQAWLNSRIHSALADVLHRLADSDQLLAIDDVRIFFEQARLHDCLQRLEEVQKRLPTDSHITLLIGLLRILMGDNRATEPLELVASRGRDPEVCMLLILARFTFGSFDHAASDLNRLLQSSVSFTNPAFIQLSDVITGHTGALGWCCLSLTGNLIVRILPDLKELQNLEVSLDGVKQLVKSKRRTRPFPHYEIVSIKPWPQIGRLFVKMHDRPLIGSGIDLSKTGHFEGFVSVKYGNIVGWCWFPGHPDTPPSIKLISREDNSPALFFKPTERVNNFEGPNPFARPWKLFFKDDSVTALQGLVDVIGPHGQQFYGSPINPRGRINSAQSIVRLIAQRFPPEFSVETSSVTSSLTYEVGISVFLNAPKPNTSSCLVNPKVAIVIPVYRGLKTTRACLESVITSAHLDVKIIVVVDASPDQELVEELKLLALTNKITLRLETINRGFPCTANIGLRMAAGSDVILLNSDTIVCRGWISRLQAAAYHFEDIGTATPISNDASIFSYPKVNETNPFLDEIEIQETDSIASLANGTDVVEVPTAHGFCMYIRSTCLQDTGVLREDVFGQGYAEENDFSRRASILGWRHVAVPGVYVGHVGGQSFSATKTHLIKRNLAALNSLHLGYDKLIARWLEQDPLLASRRKIDLIRLKTHIDGRQVVLIITHDREGGVLRHVRERAAIHSAKGRFPIILRPIHNAKGQTVAGVLVPGAEYCNLQFDSKDEIQQISDFFDAVSVTFIEVHHFLGLNKEILTLLLTTNLPYDVYVHDYSWFCPRITLTRSNNRFCGEPGVVECDVCIKKHGSRLDEKISPSDLRSRSTAILLKARDVIAPSKDAASRIVRQLSVNVNIGRWEPPEIFGMSQSSSHSRDRVKICVVGAIGFEKGFDIIYECARLAAQEDLPLEFVIVGYTCNDEKLTDTGRVKITGKFNEGDAIRLIRQQNASFAFLPALWPETWSYVLTQIWEAGLNVVAFDIGAPAERIRAHKHGVLLPLQMPPEGLLRMFLTKTLFEHIPA